MAGKRIEAILFLLTLFFLLGIPCYSLPLSAKGKYIVDDSTGKRVKLHCVNWPSHLNTMLAEGLHAKPLGHLAKTVVKLHFNCIRLTFATYMFTREEYRDRTVAESFDKLKLKEFKAGIAKNNPRFLNMTSVQAYQAVVEELGKHGLMIITDNHVSKPTWCCSDNDGNGFWGDTYNQPAEWLKGLEMVATLFKGRPEVIAVGLRNEPHGPKQNVHDWYKYIGAGATAVHMANPNVLIFASGISYANDLTYLKKKPLGVDVGNKLVYEAHWYPWSWKNEKTWEIEPLNLACPERTQFFIDQTAFMNTGDNPIPIFLGEFGLNNDVVTRASDYWLSCFLAYITEMDMDWGLWAMQGSYYYRGNSVGGNETFGVLDNHWNKIRNPILQRRYQLIKKMNIEPSSRLPEAYIMFHPQSGSCVRANKTSKGVRMIHCEKPDRWSYEGDGSPLMLKGTDLCLRAMGDGLPAILSRDCSGDYSSWTRITGSKVQLAVKDKDGNLLCLHRESPFTSNIFTRKCFCIGEGEHCLHNPAEDPTSQWFKLAPNNIDYED